MTRLSWLYHIHHWQCTQQADLACCATVHPLRSFQGSRLLFSDNLQKGRIIRRSLFRGNVKSIMSPSINFNGQKSEQGTNYNPIYPPCRSFALPRGSFVLPEKPILPVKPYQTESFCYQRNTAAISVVLIAPVTPHLGEAGGQASPLVAAAGEQGSSKESAWRNHWPVHTFPIHLHLMLLIFYQLQCQGQTEILYSVSLCNVSLMPSAFFFFLKHQ